MDLVRAFTAPLLPLYTASAGVPRSATREDMLTIDPPPRSTMMGMAALQTAAVPNTFTSNNDCHVRGSAERTVPSPVFHASTAGRLSSRGAREGSTIGSLPFAPLPTTL